MSVVVKLPGEASAHVYIKGAPETVASLCRKETGTPWGAVVHYWEAAGPAAPSSACIPAAQSHREFCSVVLRGGSQRHRALDELQLHGKGEENRSQKTGKGVGFWFEPSKAFSPLGARAPAPLAGSAQPMVVQDRF